MKISPHRIGLLCVAMSSVLVNGSCLYGQREQDESEKKTIRLVSPADKVDEVSKRPELTPQTSQSFGLRLPTANHETKAVPPLGKASRVASSFRLSPSHPAAFADDGDNPGVGFADRSGFAVQEGEMPNSGLSLISPAPRAGQANRKTTDKDGFDTQAQRDEYIYDGDDRGKRIGVDENWTIYGMETEDTFGHFDTVDGQRLVSPSNRVKIYAPRFAAVRKLDGVYNARLSTRVNALEEKLTMQMSRGKDFSSSTMQNVALNGIGSSNRASGLEESIRGVATGQSVQLVGTRNSFSAYENLDLIRWGRHSNSETARLELGMLAANVWQDNLRLQVNAKGAQPIIVNDQSRAQQIVSIEGDGKASVLRVTKVASRIAAEQGDEVEFTIRFDNMSSRPVGNVTLVDNLTGRLQYVPGSAECSLKADFIDKVNGEGSLMLRWEIIDPVKPQSGGIIRFKCKVR